LLLFGVLIWLRSAEFIEETQARTISPFLLFIVALQRIFQMLLILFN